MDPKQMYALLRMSLANPETAKHYAQRVLELENEGLTTSDAQGVADLEFVRQAQQSN